MSNSLTIETLEVKSLYDGAKHYEIEICDADEDVRVYVGEDLEKVPSTDDPEAVLRHLVGHGGEKALDLLTIGRELSWPALVNGRQLEAEEVKEILDRLFEEPPGVPDNPS